MPKAAQLVRILSVFALLTPLPSGADTIRLKNGEVIEGSARQFNKDRLTIILKDGTARQVKRGDIADINLSTSEKKSPETKPATPTPEPEPSFFDALNKPPTKFGTPEATFGTWRAAALTGDIDKMAECYASFQQKEVKNQLKKIDKEAREKMKEVTARTQFTPAKPLYQGDRAFLEVTWQNGLQSDSQVLQFVLEKNDWKLLQ